MSISFWTHDPDLTLVGRGNFFVSPALQKINPHKPFHTQRHIYETLDKLTTSRPNWRFIAIGGGNAIDYHLLTAVQVFEDNEMLGAVSIEHKGRGYKIKVDNNRISEGRKRGSGYYTEKPEKAVLAIRKYFFKAAAAERMDKAQELAGAIVLEQVRQKMHTREDAASKTFRNLRSFAESRIDEFLEFSGTRMQYEEYLDARAQHEVTARVHNALDKNECILIVLDGTSYIVRDGEDTKILSNDELPYDVRVKLGLLKLVQNKQMISDVGCRVDDSTFVLVREKEQQA